MPGSPCLSYIGPVFVPLFIFCFKVCKNGLMHRVSLRLGGLAVCWRPRPPPLARDNIYCMYIYLQVIEKIHLFGISMVNMKISLYTNNIHQQPLDHNKVTCFEHQFKRDHRPCWSKLITVSNIYCLCKKTFLYLLYLQVL